MGPLPGSSKRVPLEVRVEEETDCGSYVRRLITYAAEPGSRVPAYLLVPKLVLDGAGAQRPGVLCLMSTTPAGHKAVIGLGHKPGRNYGQELAERGFVIIAPSYPLLANYRPDLRALGYRSGTMKAIWDNIRAMDVLAAMPEVKAGGFGAIGQSLGAHNALFTALFDERVKVVVSSCGFDSFRDYAGAPWVPAKGWAMERYMPGLMDYPRMEIPFDFHEVIAALAPRPVFASAPVRDTVFRWQSAARVVAAARQIYHLYDVSPLLWLEHPDAGHDFPDEVRESAYAWIDRALR
jgi:hypothetical protein